MAEIILGRLGIEAVDAFHTIHNYIDTDEMILRKGAIAAHEGEKVLIPINMRDGSVLAIGKGNEDWNFSAPHGAGRIMSRTAAKERLDMDEYRREMAGVYTTSVNEATLDEAPMAYKSLEDIIDVIRESDLGVDSDGNEVDEPVLANGAGKQHTITLERSGNAVGGVYVAEGVEGVVYEAFHETEDGEAVTFARGTWGSSESAAEHVDDLYFSGPGVLKVLHDQLANPLIIIVR